MRAKSNASLLLRNFLASVWRELTDLVKAGGIGKDGNTRAAVYLWTK